MTGDGLAASMTAADAVAMVDCPQCHAMPGEPCTGGRAGAVHKKRADAAAARMGDLELDVERRRVERAAHDEAMQRQEAAAGRVVGSADLAHLLPQSMRAALAARTTPLPPTSNCELCRGHDLADLSWGMLAAGMLCDDHATVYRRYVAETNLRSVLPKRQWEARPEHLPPALQALDTLGSDGVYLYGKVGRGKSYLEAALLKRAYVRHARQYGNPPSFVWWRTSELLEHLRAKYAKNSKVTPEEALGALLTCDRLTLDDLGTERPTGWALEKLDLLIGHRYDHCRPTDITSNYDLAELVVHLTPEDDPHSPTGERIVSRIAEVCIQVPVTGPDRRAQKAQDRAR